MKKFFAFIVLVAMTTVLFPASAKKATASFGINTFCQSLSSKPGSDANGYGIPQSVFDTMQVFKSQKAVYNSLLNAGFTCLSKKNVREYDDALEEYYTYMKAKYTKTVSGGKIIVNQDNLSYTITFPNATEKNKFLKTIETEEAKGKIYESNQHPWVGVRFETEGNVVRVITRGGY